MGTLLDEPQKLPVVAQPASIVHALEHPSPFSRFPSSHPSKKYDHTPSPHVGSHISAPDSPAEQLNPHCIVQLNEHPSMLPLLPSSHSSVATRRPSPQMGLHAEALHTGVSHPQPTSIEQFELHPSSFTLSVCMRGQISKDQA